MNKLIIFKNSAEGTLAYSKKMTTLCFFLPYFLINSQFYGLLKYNVFFSQLLFDFTHFTLGMCNCC